ncbi:MAG TPA: efflux RND transporter periplasmic adaptor subunit [Vicinamibacteria bacterium]|nr:efflux RND transporter periplasmic adaptor subunit [Vicinamibacteria bacterium]
MRRNLGVLVALGTMLFSSCGGSQGATSARPQRQALRVRVTPVVVQDVVHQIKSLGSLEARDMVQVTAQVEGVASDVRFREGDRVSPASVLLRIDPDRHRVEAERAKALKDQAAAELGRAQADLARRESLAASQLLSTEELTRSRGENARLEAAVEVAKAAYEIALQDQRRAEVRPPITGVINTRTVDTGQFIRTGTVLATIVDVSRLRLRFKVSEAESLRAREDGRVSFGVAPLGPREFGARIYHVGRVADPTTRQVEVLAWVDPENELKPGFFAEVTLAGEKKENALVVPESAIQASERGFVTYVLDKNTARVRPVGLGLRTGTGVVEILSGLEAGEVVVSEGSDRLADGMLVEPVDGATPRAAQ